MNTVTPKEYSEYFFSLNNFGINVKIPNDVAIKGKVFIIFIMDLEEIIKSYTNKPAIIETIVQIKNRFQASGLNVENVSLALIQVMMEVNKLKNLKPSARKQMTITVLNKIVEDVCPGEDTHLEAVLKQMIPNLIDNINEMKSNIKCKCF